ncbi:hypothetical protein [Pseudomonas sp. MPB03]|uniref:hypothetical protein n=1 Tax=Pseudomonas sp. MPB03 TaxID=3388489 RepID=UPI003984E3D3
MMHSSAKIFYDFVNWLVSLRFFSDGELSKILEEFDGVQGVVESNLFISAYEEIARYLARNKTIDDMVEFFESNRGVLSELPGEQYYFVESVVDVYSDDGRNVSDLIDASPEGYREYLLNRFA